MYVQFMSCVTGLVCEHVCSHRRLILLMNEFFRYGALRIWNRFDRYGMNFIFAFSKDIRKKKAIH